MTMRSLLLAGGIAAVAAALSPVLASAARPRGTSAGVYSEAQAAEGARIYTARCAMCHGRDLRGTVETPGLNGKFVANWGRRPVGDLFDYLARAMPQPAPGTLAPDDNARLIAFLLQANGAPAGSGRLTADRQALGRITLEPAAPR